MNARNKIISPALRLSGFKLAWKTGLVAALAGSTFLATSSAQAIGTVFVIAMENTNWTQNANQFTGGQQQIFGNPAAPYLNGLVNGTAAISSQVAYASAYHNVLSTPAGATGTNSIHPSEPNYIWAEGGTNFGVFNDNQPFGSGGTNQTTSQHLTALFNNAGISWKSYQEGIDLVPNSGTVNVPGANSLTNAVAPQSQWTSPIRNFSGTSSSYVNPYNGSHQYDYAVKHNPMAFFTDTNGGNDTTTANPARLNYSPLEQLQTDLTNNTVSRYNWITPDQFNDMHSALTGGFTYNGTLYTSGAAKIAQGDNFLSKIIPLIMASQAYQNNGAIVLWWDESEPDGTGNQNDFNHTIPEIVISPLAHPNVGGLPFNSTVNLTHSDDLRSMQNIFGVISSLENPYLGDAKNAVGLNSLFAASAIPQDFVPVPEPSAYALGGVFVLSAAIMLRRRNSAARS
jgi:hypothetical protein